MATMETETKPCLTIVVPCYNEASVLEQTAQHLLAVLESMEELIGTTYGTSSHRLTPTKSLTSTKPLS